MASLHRSAVRSWRPNDGWHHADDAGELDKHPVTATDVAALNEAEVRTISRARYIEEPGFAGIAGDTLRALVVDRGVNQGPERVGAWLQDAVNDLAGRPILKVDGAVGPKTLAAVNGADAAGLWRAAFVARMCFYGDLISGDARRRGRTDDQSLNAATGWRSSWRCNLQVYFIS